MTAHKHDWRMQGGRPYVLSRKQYRQSHHWFAAFANVVVWATIGLVEGMVLIDFVWPVVQTWR